MKMKTYKVGTRQSPLALRQTELVISLLRPQLPDYDFAITPISTVGDRDQKTNLSTMGGKGVFVKEVEYSLLRGEIDFAVHSLKDLPALLPEGLTLAAFPKRATPFDCVVYSGARPDSLDGLRLGTGSIRRRKQLEKQFPNIEIQPIRGRIETRLRKAKEGGLDGIVLAYAGLERMGYLEGLTYETLSADLIVPAVGQGILGVECRLEDEALYQALHGISDAETETAALAEREFLALMNGNCDIPLGGLAQRTPTVWSFKAFLAKSTADVGKTVSLEGEDLHALVAQAYEALIG